MSVSCWIQSKALELSVNTDIVILFLFKDFRMSSLNFSMID